MSTDYEGRKRANAESERYIAEMADRAFADLPVANPEYNADAHKVAKIALAADDQIIEYGKEIGRLRKTIAALSALITERDQTIKAQADQIAALENALKDIASRAHAFLAT